MSYRSAIQKVSSEASLREAWRKISKRNMQSRGFDQVTIKSFRSNLDINLQSISEQLRAGTYAFTPLRASILKKSGSKKPRPIQVASVKDRVVMKSLALYIAPTFKVFDLPCSFAFIPEQGVKKAVQRIKNLVRDGNCHYFESDIINFFGTVNREVLWEKFSKQIRHRSILKLTKDSFDLELQDLTGFETEFQNIFAGVDSGIPQGGVLSPMLANFYLHEFDRTLLDAGFDLVRYADDFVVMCSSRERAEEAQALCIKSLSQLGLSVPPSQPLEASKTRFGYFTKDGLDFLGIRFEGEVTYPQAKVVKRFRDKVIEILNPHSGVNLFNTLQKLRNLIVGWGNSYSGMRVASMYRELDDYIMVSVQDYLSSSGIRLVGKRRGKQLRFLGIPSLTSLLTKTISGGSSSLL